MQDKLIALFLLTLIILLVWATLYAFFVFPTQQTNRCVNAGYADVLYFKGIQYCARVENGQIQTILFEKTK